MAEFKLGRVVKTIGVHARTMESEEFAAFVLKSLYRYAAGDWGDTCKEDAQSNDTALKDERRILAVYRFPKTGEEIWIITEWDRSVTTVLFPEEY